MLTVAVELDSRLPRTGFASIHERFLDRAGSPGVETALAASHRLAEKFDEAHVPNSHSNRLSTDA